MPLHSASHQEQVRVHEKRGAACACHDVMPFLLIFTACSAGLLAARGSLMHLCFHLHALY